MMYDIDVNGTQNVLRRGIRAGVQQVLVGARGPRTARVSGQPGPADRGRPGARGMPSYEYARDKTEIDRISQLWGRASTRTGP